MLTVHLAQLWHHGISSDAVMKNQICLSLKLLIDGHFVHNHLSFFAFFESDYEFEVVLVGEDLAYLPLRNYAAHVPVHWVLYCKS